MLKRVFSLLLIPAFIFNVMIFVPMVVSAAGSVYEIVQNFETSTATNVQTGNLVISETKSFVFTTGTSTFIDFGSIPAPTIANPAGVFIRYELTKSLTANGGFLGSPQPTATAAWSQITKTDGSEPINGVLASIFAPYYTIAPAGYVFLEYLPATMEGGVALGLNLSYAGLPDGLTMVFDDIGYYTGANDEANFKAVAAAVNAALPANPAKLVDAATSLPGNHILMTKPNQMSVAVLHAAGTTTKWKIDDSSIATINSDTGLVTPVSKGTAKVTAFLATDEAIKAECTITVVDGFIDVSCKDTANSSDTVFGLKPRLRAAPYYKTPSTTVVWSVVSGPATIVRDAFSPLSGDLDLVTLAETVNVQASMLTFTSSGKVVIRAALENDPSVYTDYIFNVASTFKDLQALVLDAQSMDPNLFSDKKWAAILKACDAANEMIDNGTETVTQEQIKNQIILLQKTIDLKENANTSETVDSTTSENDNPQTNDSGNALIPALFVTLLSCIAIVTLKKRITNKQ